MICFCKLSKQGYCFLHLMKSLLGKNINKVIETSCNLFIFSIWLLSVLRGHSFFHPRHNGQWPLTLMDFYTRSYPLHYCFILILEKEPVFPFFQWWVLNKGTAGTIFITSLVRRGPWLGIEPGSSRTRSQHSTTRLLRRRLRAGS